MDSFQYSIIYSDALTAPKIANELQTKLKKYQVTENRDKPNLVFIIGGDGTFLKALNQYNHQIKDIKFVAFKQGNIGFYHSFDVKEMDELLDCLFQKKQKLYEYQFDLLEINSANQQWFAINEFRLLNLVQTISFDILINDQLWEPFRGSGIVIATKTGAAGLMKAAGGALILANSRLMELQEIFPVNNNFYSSIRSPIILDEQQTVTVRFPTNWERFAANTKIVVDTYLIHDKLSMEITIKIAKQLVTTLSFHKNNNFLFDKIKTTFTKITKI